MKDLVVRNVTISPVGVAGTLRIPKGTHGLVVFVHGSGSSRFSPRNMTVAEGLNNHSFATLLFDLLTPQEEQDRANVFNIELLTRRLIEVVHWIDDQNDLSCLDLGLFGASTGAAAALVGAAELGERIKAVVSRGGRPDLAGPALVHVRSPTLLIVGGNDFGVIELNEEAYTRIQAPKALEIVAGASHLFPESGALEVVIGHAARWFDKHLHAE